MGKRGMGNREPAPGGRRYFRLDRRDLVYFKFILEAYEGLTTLSTVEKEGVTVVVTAPPDFRDEVDHLLRALGGEIRLTEVVPEGDGFREVPSRDEGGDTDAR
jgi:hypothetical protein